MSTRWSTIWRTWQGIAERLRRRGALVSLGMLLLIGLIEPLACVVHCSIMELTHSHTLMGSHHHAMSAAPDAAEGDLLHGMTVLICSEDHSSVSGTSTCCNAPTPQPFHEMMLLAVVVLLPLALVVRRVAPMLPPPAEFFSPPRLRPPLLCA